MHWHLIFILYSNLKDFKSNIYQSVLAIALGLLVLYFLYHSNILLILAIGVILSSLIHQKIANFISKIWEGLAYLLGLIMPKIFLALVYFLILTPIAFCSKIFKRKNKKVTINSNFIERNKTFIPKDFEQTW